MKKSLITGLLIWIPLAITIWVLDLIVSTMDQSLLLLPPQYQPQVLFGYQIPGLGALLTVVVLFVTAVRASNIPAQRRPPFWGNALRRIPGGETLDAAVDTGGGTSVARGRRSCT